MTIAGSPTIAGTTLTNNGTINWTAGTMDVGQGAIINNSGLFNITSDQAVQISSGAPAPTWNNSGTFRKFAGTGTSNMGVGAFNNSGTVEILIGLLVFNGFTQTAGTTRLNGGNLTANGGVTLQGGVLQGNGTVTANVTNNAGTVGPGLSAGTLTITGNYTQGANGTLAIELGGTTAGQQYDVLNVAGTATLNGVLSAGLISSYIPNAGDTFTVMTYASHTGNFSAITGTSLGGGKSLQEATNATNVVLTTTLLPSGDANGDGAVTVADVFYIINNLFAGGPNAVGPADPNGDGRTSVADVFYLINFLFAGGPPPV